MKYLLLALALVPGFAFARVPSSPSLGIAEGRCRANEPGPALMITVIGLKDRGGTIKAELYPANDTDFLADDNVLVSEGKTFRRVVIATPGSGSVQLCLRAPAAGSYGLSLLHDRDGNRKFSLSIDGIGLGGNPESLGPTKPKIAVGRVSVASGVTPVTVRMMYRRGLFSFGPLR